MIYRGPVDTMNHRGIQTLLAYLFQLLGTFRVCVVRQTGDPFEAVCDGCEITCDGCVFKEELLAPACADIMDHAASEGGNVTLDAISIDRGFWRATESSTEILTCYHADACLGGVTAASDYCLKGYEGPCACCV